jgi:hypothetical protein
MNLSYEELQKAIEMTKKNEREAIIKTLEKMIGGDETIEKHRNLNECIKGIIRMIEARDIIDLSGKK